jgi:hypothetical protein
MDAYYLDGTGRTLYLDTDNDLSYSIQTIDLVNQRIMI